MTFASRFLSAAVAGIMSLAVLLPGAQAGTKMTKAEAQALVQPFYDFLDGSASEADARANFDPAWISHYSIEGTKDLDGTMKFLGGPLRQMVPDLTWRIVNLSVTHDNKVVVIGEATGTPAGEKFFGQPVTGGSFKIMSIDVHEVENGKVMKSYHIEDWAGALRQLAAQ